MKQITNRYFPGKNYPWRLTVWTEYGNSSTNYDNEEEAMADFNSLKESAVSIRLQKNGKTVLDGQ